MAGKIPLKISRRAALDLVEIEQYSISKWGKKTAKEYINAIEQALTLLQENPKILRKDIKVSAYFHLYKVGQHFLVFDVTKDSLNLLTIKHGSMDLSERLDELEPY
ncbi:MAG: type II toxin-antitoxin system RelE/ParE family toxin, partial [Pseudomonadota bacterium]